jgi:hypothetical protein
LWCLLLCLLLSCFFPFLFLSFCGLLLFAILLASETQLN